MRALVFPLDAICPRWDVYWTNTHQQLVSLWRIFHPPIHLPRTETLSHTNNKHFHCGQHTIGDEWVASSFINESEHKSFIHFNVDACENINIVRVVFRNVPLQPHSSLIIYLCGSTVCACDLASVVCVNVKNIIALIKIDYPHECACVLYVEPSLGKMYFRWNSPLELNTHFGVMVAIHSSSHKCTRITLSVLVCHFHIHINAFLLAKRQLSRSTPPRKGTHSRIHMDEGQIWYLCRPK